MKQQTGKLSWFKAMYCNALCATNADAELLVLLFCNVPMNETARAVLGATVNLVDDI
jgi:hypothetical protein